MRQFTPYPLRWMMGTMLLLSGGCADNAPTEPAQQPPPQQPQPEPPAPPQTPPHPSAGIHGISDPFSIVCARDGAGTSWCTVAGSTGAFHIVESNAAPGTGTGPLPENGYFQIYNVACPARGGVVDRAGAQRAGGDWLDVRCAPEACAAPLTGLLAWYRFDETGGDTVADYADAVPRAPLRLTSAVARVTGRVLQGIEFAGEPGYAEGSTAKNLGTGDFSIAAWIRFQSSRIDSFSTLLDKRDRSPLRGYHIAFNWTEPLLQLADGGDWGSSYNYHGRFSIPADGQWHFLVVTVERASRTGLRWYLDGAPAGVISDPTGRQGSLDSNAPLHIGRHSYSSHSGFSGGVDEFQIVNRVLSPDEISALYAKPGCR